MVLAYRFNAPEPPRTPAIATPEEVFQPGDDQIYRARVSPVTTRTIMAYSASTQPWVVITQEQEVMLRKSKSKTKGVGGKGVGIIAKIIETISRDRGASIDEIVAVLSKHHPDRDEAGMAATARVQALANCTS